MFSHISGRILVGVPVIPAVAEAQNSSTGSQVTPPAELIEMVQYCKGLHGCDTPSACPVLAMGPPLSVKLGVKLLESSNEAGEEKG